jgi:hypothetical protein
MSNPPNLPWFNHPNNIRRRIQAVKFIIMQLSTWSIFLPFRSKYPPQHSVLKNPQSVFLPQNERPSFAPIQHKWDLFRYLSEIIPLYFTYDPKRTVRIHSIWLPASLRISELMSHF